MSETERCSIYTYGVQCLRMCEHHDWMCLEHRRETEARYDADFDEFVEIMCQGRIDRNDSKV